MTSLPEPREVQGAGPALRGDTGPGSAVAVPRAGAEFALPRDIVTPEGQRLRKGTKGRILAFSPSDPVVRVRYATNRTARVWTADLSGGASGSFG